MADNPYTPVSISGYNANPPPDDGTQVSDNEITWAKHKTKFGDPLKTGIEAVDTNVSAAFGQTINIGSDQNNQMSGSLAFSHSELTLASGVVTPTRTHHTIDTEADAATDDVDSINPASVSDGAILIVRNANSGRVSTLKHQTVAAPNPLNLTNGREIELSGDNSATLQLRSSEWYELSRSAPPIGLINVRYVQKTDPFTTTSTTFVDVTDLSITPTLQSASNLVRLRCTGFGSVSAVNGSGFLRFTRDGTAIGVADAAGSRVQAHTSFSSDVAGTDELPFVMEWFDDSPGGTAPVYKVQLATEVGTAALGSQVTDSNATTTPRGVTVFQVEELGVGTVFTP